MEEVKVVSFARTAGTTIGYVAIAATVFLTTASKAQEQRPKIMSSGLCGVVTDLAGKPIAGASVAAMWADFGTNTTANALGLWSFGKNAGPHWMKVEASGFESFVFDYVDEADPKDTGANKPAFDFGSSDKSCPVPIHVRLAATGSQAGTVSLDARSPAEKSGKS